MRAVELKLKQASAVLGMPTKELQNLVQFGVVKPRRRRGLYLFDMVCLYQAQVAGHLKLALGTPANKLTEFVEAFSEFLKRGENELPDVLVFTSSSKYWTRPVEVKLPLKQLRESLEARLERVDLYRDLPTRTKAAKLESGVYCHFERSFARYRRHSSSGCSARGSGIPHVQEGKAGDNRCRRSGASLGAWWTRLY